MDSCARCGTLTISGTRAKACAFRFVRNTILNQHEPFCAMDGLCRLKPTDVSLFTPDKAFTQIREVGCFIVVRTHSGSIWVRMRTVATAQCK